MNAKPCECEHDFTLAISGVTELTPEIVDAFFEAGCDDATLVMRSGRLFATFSRRAGSIKEAILSAIANVRNAGAGIDVLRVDYCNLVTQADIARKIGRTRQLVHQYIIGVRGPGGFPGPVCEIIDGTYLWYWCEVAYWLWENDMITEDVLRDAEEVDAISSALEMIHQKKRNPGLTEEIKTAICPE
jgi:hypothetical protein